MFRSSSTTPCSGPTPADATTEGLPPFLSCRVSDSALDAPLAGALVQYTPLVSRAARARGKCVAVAGHDVHRDPAALGRPLQRPVDLVDPVGRLPVHRERRR